ncbi:SDR family oxidoreductase [Acetobacter oeni]|nr:SDR family oxidoreductase [Acetobacter oeni]MBB3881758.1 NAD(P)-dependent dehydrogenase (short-subunit alcohol dehydrogenase family) [Acetobacter oeni]
MRIPRAALVTGASRRLGRAIARSLAETGFSIAIHYRSDEEAASSLLAEIRTLGVQGCLLQADFADEEQVRGLVPQAMAALGPLGVLVNNASTFERDEWDTVTRQSWQEHIEPNLRAPFVLIQDFARALPKGSEAMVLNMLDERVWSLTPHFVSYTVSKSALWTLTQTMALALAPRRIRVNAIGPGPALPSPRQTAEQFRRQCESVPLGHGTSPEEVAQAALALLALPSVTGQMLALDGGQHLQWHCSLPDAGHLTEE